MTNTHSTFLKEMGITEWTSRDAIPMHSQAPVEPNPQVSSEIEGTQQKVTRGMWWFFGTEPQGDAKILFQNMIRVLGISRNEWSWKVSSDNLGQLRNPGVPVVAIAFGGSVAQKITGERDPLPQLRETILALNTGNDEEIPVIASFELNQVISKPKDKALLWQDLLMARSVLQET